MDLCCLERAGFKVEDFLEDAMQKDGGVTPATVAWILSGLSVPAGLPEGVSPEGLRDFLRNLEARMRRLAVPGPPAD